MEDFEKNNIFNQIIDFYTTRALNEYSTDYKFIFITGRPGAGKSSYIEDNSLEDSYMLIDSDEIILKIDELQNDLTKKEKLNLTWDIRHQLLVNLTKMGINIVFPTTIIMSKLEEYIDLVCKQGYKISLVHLNIGIEEAYNRCSQRYLTNINREILPHVIERNDYDRVESVYKNDSRIADFKIINQC